MRNRGVDLKGIRTIFKTAIRENIAKITNSPIQNAEFVIIGSRKMPIGQHNILLVDNFGIRGKGTVFDTCFRRNPVCIFFDNKTVIIFLVRTVMYRYFVSHTIHHAGTTPQLRTERIYTDSFLDRKRDLHLAASLVLPVFGCRFKADTVTGTKRCFQRTIRIIERTIDLLHLCGKRKKHHCDLTEGLLTAVKSSEDCFAEDGTDCRNYGGLDGLPEAKALFAPMLGVTPDELIICGNSSLNIMYDTIAKFMLFGTGDGEKPWKDTKVKWLCPVPGYDRHFLITEKMGFELVNIPMDKNGPDMDMVEKLVAEDDTIKGIWCVPMYANPTGTTYSDEVVKRLAAMTTKAKDFKIFWDNAYCIHHLSDTPDTLLNILDECEKAGNPDRVYMLASTSKVTFPGAGVAMIASSEKNIKYLKSMMTVQTIGYDKINQLRHVKFFGTYENLMEHMKKHRAIIEPKFKIVLDTLEKEIAPLGIGSWEKPNGGYFISFNALNGCAKRICQLCKEAGVVLTGAGATYPYGKDPDDSSGFDSVDYRVCGWH